MDCAITQGGMEDFVVKLRVTVNLQVGAALKLTVPGAVTSIGRLYITSSQCNRMQPRDARPFSLTMAMPPPRARTIRREIKNCVHNPLRCRSAP